MIKTIERRLLEMGPAVAGHVDQGDWTYSSPFSADWEATALCGSYLHRWAAIWEILKPQRYMCVGLLLGTMESWCMRATGHRPGTIVALDVDLHDYNPNRDSMSYAYRNITHPSSGGFEGELVLIRGDSKVCNLHLRLGPYDVAYIDGEHSYAAARSDMNAAAACLTGGGVILVHDLDLPGGDDARDIRTAFRDWHAAHPDWEAVEVPATHFQLGLGLLQRGA